MGLLLILLTPLLLAVGLHRMGIPVHWLGVVFGVAVGVAVGVMFGVVGGVAGGVAGGVVVGVAGGVAVGVVCGVAFGVVFGVALGVACGVAFGMAIGVAFGVTDGVALLRLPDYLAIMFPTAWRWSRGGGSLNHVTPIPLPNVQGRLEAWLEEDWAVGVHNVNQILAYTLQFIPAVRAINRVLERMPEERILPSVAELARAPYDWDLVRFGSASLREALWNATQLGFMGFLIIDSRFRRRLLKRFTEDPRLDTPARAACAGFWYLHKKDPEKAAEAFAVVRALPGGAEMARLSEALAAARRAAELPAIARLDEQFLQNTIPPERDSAHLLHPTAWIALERLRWAALEARTVQTSFSRANRSRALNRALGEINALLQESDTIPRAERELFHEVAVRWRDALLAVAGEVGEVAITRPVLSPYVIGGDPVIGKGFVGREDIMRRLEEYWAGSAVPPSVALYGHRRMGKTSILRNIPGRLGASVHLAYANLLILGDLPGGAAELLLTIGDAVRRALDSAGYSPPSLEEAALSSQPYRAFEHFLLAVRRSIGESRLIIALDEFEQLEEWINRDRLPHGFLKVLRGYIQLDPQIAFVFAGLHTLDDMNADYFEPFFTSVVSEKVSFLKREAVYQILANPSPTKDEQGQEVEFPLDYAPEALERVWQWTAGQPYLVQLIGGRLVSRFNDLTFEQGRRPEPIFRTEDVDAVVNSPEFYDLGRYYFTGVWGQVGRGAAGQQRCCKPWRPGQKMQGCPSRSCSLPPAWTNSP
ncbi:MAG: ATP-binding protein [Clostridia bacterium]|nr:ATP-binding protein [Clostridia bacterium]